MNRSGTFGNSLSIMFVLKSKVSLEGVVDAYWLFLLSFWVAFGQVDCTFVIYLIIIIALCSVADLLG